MGCCSESGKRSIPEPGTDVESAERKAKETVNLAVGTDKLSQLWGKRVNSPIGEEGKTGRKPKAEGGVLPI